MQGKSGKGTPIKEMTKWYKLAVLGEDGKEIMVHGSCVNVIVVVVAEIRTGQWL